MSKEDIAAIACEVETQMVDQLKRRMAWESKKISSQLKGFTFALEKALGELEQSVEILARELVRRGRDVSDSPSEH